MDSERQNIEANMREKRLLALYSDVRIADRRDCTGEVRRSLGWWRMGIWELVQSARGNTDHGMCPTWSKNET